MIWELKRKGNKRPPIPGEKRTIDRFAWLPTKVKSGNVDGEGGKPIEYIIWLEKYSQQQIWNVSTKHRIGATYSWINKKKILYGYH